MNSIENGSQIKLVDRNKRSVPNLHPLIEKIDPKYLDVGVRLVRELGEDKLKYRMSRLYERWGIEDPSEVHLFLYDVFGLPQIVPTVVQTQGDRIRRTVVPWIPLEESDLPDTEEWNFIYDEKGGNFMEKRETPTSLLRMRFDFVPIFEDETDTLPDKWKGNFSYLTRVGGFGESIHLEESGALSFGFVFRKNGEFYVDEAQGCLRRSPIGGKKKEGTLETKFKRKYISIGVGEEVDLTLNSGELERFRGEATSEPDLRSQDIPAIKMFRNYTEKSKNLNFRGTLVNLLSLFKDGEIGDLNGFDYVSFQNF